MRFLPEGPNIPDELLEERDEWERSCSCVVQAFPTLPECRISSDWRSTSSKSWVRPKTLRREICCPCGKTSISLRGARPSLDQIFNLLQQEYQPAEIDHLIAKRLKRKPRTSLSAHDTILRLSRSADGKPQVVTTNFDLLFEKAANRNVKAHVAPVLPDLAGAQSV